jgi:hypothetical protein
MRPTSLHRLLLPLCAMLSISACHGGDGASQPGGSTPQAALQTSIDLLKAGDFNALWKHALPPADYATMRADWTRQGQNQAPLTPADRARFTDTMQKLTGPDAENKLYAEAQPKLAVMEQQYKDQLPVLISVGQAVVKNGIARNESLTADEKSQVGSVLDVLGPWAQQTPWFDQTRAKQAIGVAVATARKLDLKSPDQLRSLDFDTAMTKYSTLFAGARQLLAVYGLSIDNTLDSVKLTPVSSDHGHAVVKIDYTLLGKPLSTRSNLVQQDGRWYSQDLVDNVRKSHQQLTAQASTTTASPTAPAAAGTAATKD